MKNPLSAPAQALEAVLMTRLYFLFGFGLV